MLSGLLAQGRSPPLGFGLSNPLPQAGRSVGEARPVRLGTSPGWSGCERPTPGWGAGGEAGSQRVSCRVWRFIIQAEAGWEEQGRGPGPGTDAGGARLARSASALAGHHHFPPAPGPRGCDVPPGAPELPAPPAKVEAALVETAGLGSIPR